MEKGDKSRMSGMLLICGVLVVADVVVAVIASRDEKNDILE